MHLIFDCSVLAFLLLHSIVTWVLFLSRFFFAVEPCVWVEPRPSSFVDIIRVPEKYNCNCVCVCVGVCRRIK